LGGGATDHSPPPTNFFGPPKTVSKGPKNNTHSSLSGFKSFLFLSKKCISKDVTNKDMTFFETILQKCINKTSRNKLYFLLYYRENNDDFLNFTKLAILYFKLFQLLN